MKIIAYFDSSVWHSVLRRQPCIMGANWFAIGPDERHMYFGIVDQMHGYLADEWDYVGHLPDDEDRLKQFRYRVIQAPSSHRHTEIIDDINKKLTAGQAQVFRLPSRYAINDDCSFVRDWNKLGKNCTHDWVDTGMRRSWCKHCDADAKLNEHGEWEPV